MGFAVDDKKMITDFVELVEVAARIAHLRRGDRGHFLIEDRVAQTLGLFDLMLGFGESHFQNAGARQNRPLLEAAFKRPGLVNVDQDRVPHWAERFAPPVRAYAPNATLL